MAQISNISKQLQLKCSGERFYELFKNKMDSITQMFPKKLLSYKIVEGNGFAHGSVVHWKYELRGTLEAKQKLHMDDTNKAITLEFIEGDLFKDFEMVAVKGEVSDGGSNGISSVKWSVEFVKANEGVAPPHNYLQFALESTKGIEAYLCNNN
ncbi:MLP-like protein 34 isoform X1 [Cucurbita moschata]|uniref:MLP-like protein 34 isoform X1 n=1 Tax=Cucurbita moschata TaxID=3662 RepID=A0A6J1G803_CUCMO|nr:MLP-like protein 34 isoform X1 [Cucurbita moschata]